MSAEQLQLKIKELEKKLELLTSQNNQKCVVREKISEMSAEVVDSNPYRYVNFSVIKSFV